MHPYRFVVPADPVSDLVGISQTVGRLLVLEQTARLAEETEADAETLFNLARGHALGDAPSLQ